ncbi:MAG: TOMM precursor leader peptide-binding protein [Planctomycetaceae bacterium]
MLRRPRFRPHYRTEVVEREGVFVLSATEQIVLQGSLYELVVPLLDGRPLEDVCGALRERAAPSKIIYTIRKLQERGLVVEGDDGGLAPEDAFWSAQDVDPPEARRRLAETTVSVRSIGVDADVFRALLEASSVRLDDDGDLTVVVADHYLRRELQEWNRAALTGGKPWLLVKPTGAEIWIGPLFRPGSTGCWECLAHRLRCNLPIVSYLESLLEDRDCPAIDVTSSPASLSVAWGLAANSVATWIAGGGRLDGLEGTIQSYDVVNSTSATHRLIQQPFCPECGDDRPSSNGTARPLVLESRQKTYTEDGGHRSASPPETIARYGHHVSPICGAVTMLESSVPGNDGVMHVYVSGANVARGARSLGGLRSDLRESSCGKGMNDLQAKAGALCEGLERYSGLFRGDEPRRTASLISLGDSALHPNDCMLFSETQYARREERNASPSVYNSIPQRFDPEREIEWTPVWSLTRGCPRYLPTSYCFFEYPHDCGADFCVGCSNGNAAGNNLEEAILQGFFELVERDSVGLWWYNRGRVPGVDLDSFDEPYLHRLKAYLKRHQRTLWALDLSSDLQIPAFAALSRRTTGPTEQLMFGFGAHFDPRIGLMRAVTELNQMLVPLLGDDDRADGLPPEFSDAETSNWLNNATLEAHPFLVPADRPPRRKSDFPNAGTDDLKEDVLLCKSMVEQRGFEFLVLDQTRSEIGMPVVKVFVPGLRHFWARFAPGRLYDVPVELGWIDEPLNEDQLNPNPMFL